MKTVKIRKGQRRINTDGKEVCDAIIQIPLEHFNLLGWKHGEELKITSDKKTGKLIAEKMGGEKHEREFGDCQRNI